MANTLLDTRPGRFFWKVTAYPKTLLTLGFLTIITAGAFIPQLTRDTTPDSFLPKDLPALVYRDTVEEIFGLKDPMIVAVVNEGVNGIFNPHSLGLVSWLTERIAEVPGIDPDRITSLATEDDIIGTEDGMLVEPFFETPPATQEEADRVRDAVMDFPLYLGSLVARDGTATLVVAEVLEDDRAPEVYKALLALANEAPVKEETLHVAGEGAVSGYLASYIDADARRLNPMAGLLITLVLFVAYRTLRGVMLPSLVVLATVTVVLGSMAGAGIPFYVITNALPVILIGIAVADSIHILSQYYEELTERPDAPQRELVVRAMAAMWRPVTITSLTTIAGFVGISAASVMPPMQAFGLFAALGVGVAWLFSLFVLPCGLVMIKPKSSRAYRPPPAAESGAVADRYTRVMGMLGRGVARRPGLVLALAGVIAVAGVAGGVRLEANAEWINNFQRSEPIYQADRTINRLMDGTSYLDVVIETPEPEDLFKPENLQRIEALQTFLETLPHVNGTTSIVDYLKQMNRAMHEDRPEAYRLPDDPDLVAQYFLLYSASGDPTDFEEEIDYDYRLANVRAMLDTGLYSDVKVVVEAVQRYIADEFTGRGMTANLSGRVTVDYHWFERLLESHFRSVAIALVAVWLMAGASFRSMVAGTLALAPVALAVLLVYAFMGMTGMWLSVGTSMFAAIAIGVGVDFSVHTIDRLIILLRHQRQTLEDAFAALFPSTGRALLFNFAAVFFGFGVLATSSVPPLMRFGFLVAVAVSVSFLASMTVLPALVKVLRPAFLGFERGSPLVSWRPWRTKR